MLQQSDKAFLGTFMRDPVRPIISSYPPSSIITGPHLVTLMQWKKPIFLHQRGYVFIGIN